MLWIPGRKFWKQIKNTESTIRSQEHNATHTKKIQQQNTGTLVICKNLIIVICTYHIAVSTFRWGDAKLKLILKTFLEMVFILAHNPVRDLAWSQGFVALGNKYKLFTEMQSEGQKATSKFELLKCSLQKQPMVETKPSESRKTRENSTETWSIFETDFTLEALLSATIRLLDSWKGHVMGTFPSHKQMVQEKLISHPVQIKPGLFIWCSKPPDCSRCSKEWERNYYHM